VSYPRSLDLHALLWCWPSIDGIVKLHVDSDGQMKDADFRVLDIEVTYMTEDVYGTVTSGAVRLEGYPLRQVVEGELIVNAILEKETSLPERTSLSVVKYIRYYLIFNGVKVDLGLVSLDDRPAE
jgi:hypothetical protein